MKYLNYYTPAETIFILKGKDAKIADQLKFTFMDLLLKDVLRVLNVEKQVPETNRILKYKYIEAGSCLHTYIALNHEKIFLYPFRRNNDLQIFLRHIVKIGTRNSMSIYDYRSNLLKSANLKSFFKQSLIQKLTGNFSITPFGYEVRSNIESEIKTLETEIADLIATNPEKVSSLLRVINGNLFLLDISKIELLKLFDVVLMDELDNNNDLVPKWYDNIWLDLEISGFNFEVGIGSGCSGCGGGCGGD